MSLTHCRACHRLHELCVCRSRRPPPDLPPLHTCPRCMGRHRGHYDHCEPCRVEIAEVAKANPPK